MGEDIVVGDVGQAQREAAGGGDDQVARSGSVDSGGLVLRADTADRLAGTLTIADSGVKTTIEFDATLLKAFPAQQ